LVLQVRVTGRHDLVDLVHEVEQIEGAVIDVELGVVEGHAEHFDDARRKLRGAIDSGGTV